MDVRFRVDDRAALAGLRAARRGLQREVRLGVTGAAHDTILPRVQAATPRRGGGLERSEKAGATARGAYIEARKPYAGLINFGGIRRDVIRPRNPDTGPKALSFGGGVVAVVRGPRKYRGQHFIEKGITAGLPEALPRIRDAALRPFAPYFPTSR